VNAHEPDLHPETGNNIHPHNIATLTYYKKQKTKSKKFFPEIGPQG
jgi:hypothetical protein